MHVRILSFLSGNLLQAVRMHLFFHLSINFMFDFGILQQGMLPCDPLLDISIRVVASVVALLAQLHSFSTSESDSTLVP